MRFVILGGGTAGWMAACLIAHRWPQHRVTVVESPEIGIIGVGEGSTPQLKSFFDQLGIAESEWMPRCNATYKTGIRFVDWSRRAEFDSYFHPFPTAVDDHTAHQFYFNTRARRTGRDVEGHPDRFFLNTRLAAERCAPIAPANFPFRIGYGYHFDATLVGAFLRDHAVGMLGVAHLQRTIARVDVDGGVVRALHDDAGGVVEGDVFIDASGFRGSILQQALGEPFIGFGDNLFNDAAVAVPTPNDGGELPCETRATTLSAGWVWRIPLTNRAGNGYVYSSAYTDAEGAERELRAHLRLGESDVAVRHLRFKVGRVARSWVSNAVAIGLAQGFIEPLEATALHIVQTTVEMFLDAYETGGMTNAGADDFNAAIGRRYDGIRDYIVAHYRMNQRGDTNYWRANAANTKLSESLRAMMTVWFTGADMTEEIARQQIAGYYAPLSWHCLFAGYGTYPGAAKLMPPEAGLGIADMTAIDAFIDGCRMNFPSHGETLAAMC